MFKHGKRIRKFHNNALVIWFLMIEFVPLGVTGIFGFFMKDSLNIPTIILLSSIPIIGALLIFYFLYKSIHNEGFFSRIKQKQMIARMILSAQLYETKARSGSRDKIKWPKLYYKFDKTDLTVDFTFPMNGGRYHEQFGKIGKKLEEMFVGDLIGEDHSIGFVTYTMVANVAANRISIEKVTIDKTSIKLMKNVVWDFTKSPHMLISGGTGGGKTYFLFSLIFKLIGIGTVDICDPKRADLFDLKDLKAFRGHIFTGTKDITECLNNAVEEMEDRYNYMKVLPNYVSGKNYAYYGIAPHFIIVDEWSAFFGTLDFNEQKEINKAINQLVLKARQAGIFLILAMQRPDAEYFGSGVRDNFMFKVTLGQLSESGYHMIFGDEFKNKSFFNKNIRGRGYSLNSGDMPQEFYSPIVPKTFNFMNEFAQFDKMIAFNDHVTTQNN